MSIYNDMPQYVKDLVTIPDNINGEFFWYWFRQLFQKVVSVFDFKDIPETIDETYFVNMLMARGYVTFFNDEKFGLVAQNGFPVDYDLYWRPQAMRVCNRFINFEGKLGIDCLNAKLTNDYMGVLDIVVNYSRRLALAETSLQTALFNTRLGYALFPSTPAAAKAFEKMIDKLVKGEPVVMADKSYLVENCNNNNQDEPFQLVQDNVGQNYIIDKLLNDIATIIGEFDAEVGIPSANTNKKERLINAEVSFGNADTMSKIRLWKRCLQDSLDEVNAMFGINISFEYKYEDYDVMDTGKEKEQ